MRSPPAATRHASFAGFVEARDRALYAGETLRLLGLKKGSVDRALSGLVGKAEARRTPAGPELSDPLLEHWLAERGLFRGASCG
jgi:hypothetical protein